MTEMAKPARRSMKLRERRAAHGSGHRHRRHPGRRRHGKLGRPGGRWLRPGIPRLVDGGLPLVLSQTFRTLLQSRMQVGLARYAQQYPYIDQLVFEPNALDNKDSLFAGKAELGAVTIR